MKKSQRMKNSAKKGLSTILATTMGLSMFASLAMAKTSADFSDLRDLDAATKAKYDAMISAGIFDGIAEGTFGLKDKMNRAQFAKVAALVYGLNVNSSLTTSAFSDVKADDPANGYALPYIEAVRAAGITDGYAPGLYNPAGEVTKEQLAAFLIRGLGKDAVAKATPGVQDASVSDWAKGYAALALQMNLLFNDANGSFGGTASATRDLLVTGSYSAKQQYAEINKPAKVSVSSAYASGVSQVTVILDRDVDTAKATLSLSKGSVPVDTTVSWSADKKTATLALTNVKVSSGVYNVTLGGLDASIADKTSASFAANDETLKSIDFVGGSDSVAYSANAVLKLSAKNQYGENATFSSGDYSVYTSGASLVNVVKKDDGSLLLTLNTKGGGLTQGASVIPVTVVSNSQHVTTSKTFKLGTAPLFSKIELGSAQYSNASGALSSKGDSATFDLNIYDQYGNAIAYNAAEFDPSKVSVIWNDYLQTAAASVEDNGNNVPRLKIALTDNADKTADYNFTVADQAAITTGKISVKSTKIATKVQVGAIDDVIAAGDKDVYLPVIAYDAQGNQLSVDDLTSAANVARIGVNVSGATFDSAIVASGVHRGTIHLKNIAGSKSLIVATLTVAGANANSFDSKTFTVADARIPDHFKEVAAPAKETLPGSSTSFQYVVYDQYGKQLDRNVQTDGNGNAGTSVTYDVYASLTGDASFSVTKDDASQKSTPLNNGKPANTAGANIYGGSDDTASYAFKQFNQGLRIWAGDAGKSTKLHLAIRKTVSGQTPVEISSIDKTVAGASATEDVTYSIGSVGDLFAAIDSGIAASAPDAGTTKTIYNATTDAVSSAFRKEIAIGATTAAGDFVSVPGIVQSVFSSNPSVVKVGIDTNASSPTYNKAFAIGNKAGSATITVSYLTNKGETKMASVNVNVKSDYPAIASLTAGHANASVAAGSYNINDSYSYAPTGGLMNLKAVDQYGVSYQNGTIRDYNFAFGILYTTSRVTLKDSTVTDAAKNGVSVAGNVVTIGTNVASFDLNAYAPNGKTATTTVSVN